MSIATDLVTFIQQVGDHVFIEAEGKPSMLNNFIQHIIVHIHHR